MMVKAMTVPWLVVGTLICEGMVKNGRHSKSEKDISCDITYMGI